MKETVAITSYMKLNKVFQAQKATSKRWKTEPIDNRINRLKSIRDWVLAHRDEIKEAIYLDFQKPAEEVDLSEVYVVLSEIKHALTNLKAWTKPKKAAAPLAMIGSQSYVQMEPKGVVLIIAPWNFPFNLTIAPLVSALAAGNTAILKPSELTPNCTQLMQKLVGELFNDDEVFIASGDQKVAQELLQLPFDHIFFTGSPRVGKIIMEAASKHLTSVTLELGGKSPVIIDPTADLTDAAEKLAWGKFINAGQTCIAPDYIMAHRSIRSQFIDELRMAIDRLFDDEGLGMERSKAYARVINDHHYQRLSAMIKDAVDHGAQVEYGGETNEAECYIAPTVLSNLDPASKVLQEEIFGPILPVTDYDDLDQAIDYINQRPKPLALYVFSSDKSAQNRILKETSSGSAAVNDCVIQFMNPNLPFGGVSNSGFGKSHGETGFIAFSNQKSVLKQRQGMTSIKPVYPPYTDFAHKAIEMLIRYF